MRGLAAAVVEAARTAGRRLTVAESCTGGMVTAALTDVPGASGVLDRSVVCYSNAAKQGLLGVQPETLDAHGAVSEEVAAQMAEGALAAANADLAVSITGIAGPGGSDHKPEGRVCFALAARDAATSTLTVEYGSLGRAGVRDASCAQALRLLLAGLGRG
ncbi:MAG: CinA family protein [Alkalilacustris sp.]